VGRDGIPRIFRGGGWRDDPGMLLVSIRQAGRAALPISEPPVMKRRSLDLGSGIADFGLESGI